MPRPPIGVAHEKSAERTLITGLIRKSVSAIQSSEVFNAAPSFTYIRCI